MPQRTERWLLILSLLLLSLLTEFSLLSPPRPESSYMYAKFTTFKKGDFVNLRVTVKPPQSKYCHAFTALATLSKYNPSMPLVYTNSTKYMQQMEGTLNFLRYHKRYIVKILIHCKKSIYLLREFNTGPPGNNNDNNN